MTSISPAPVTPSWGTSNKSSGSFGTTTIHSEDVVDRLSNEIPIIDISPIFNPSISSRLAVAAQLRAACITTGFFYVRNHGIPQALIDGVFEWGKRFFELEFEEKMEVYIGNTSHYRGYTPLYGAGVKGDDGRGSRCLGSTL